MQKSIFQNIFIRFGWLIITLFSVFLFGLTVLYFYHFNDHTYNFLGQKQDVVFNRFWKTSFWIHITGGMFALLIGPFQFVKWIRKKYMKTHRWLGKVYLISILVLGAPAGLFMGFYAEGGWTSSMGFILMGVLWLVFTYLAYETIRKKKIEAHRAWMTRSFALTFAAVTLRIWVPLASYYLHFSQNFVVQSSAWISWIPNLIVAELLLLIIPKKL